MKQWYRGKDFTASSMAVIKQANEIIEDYVAQGFILTLRQIYYQFVARDLLPNVNQSYKRLGSIVGDARLAGLIDWRHIEDRTRELRGHNHLEDPADCIKKAAQDYVIDKWQEQDYRVEVWIEKDALVGVIEGVCSENDVDYFSCRGYSSLSAMHRAANRMIYHEREAKTIIFHLGDHDPSGIDMTRDIQDRMHMFESEVEVRRIALNMDQIDELGPPPNPAKTTDARSGRYIEMYGEDSWELDALEPSYMVNLVQSSIDSVRDEDQWQEMVEREAKERRMLSTVADQWDDVELLVEPYIEEDE